MRKLKEFFVAFLTFLMGATLVTGLITVLIGFIKVSLVLLGVL